MLVSLDTSMMEVQIAQDAHKLVLPAIFQLVVLLVILINSENSRDLSVLVLLDTMSSITPILLELARNAILNV